MSDDHKTVGARRRGRPENNGQQTSDNSQEQDVHATGRASRDDVHATGKASRSDVHATGKAVRGTADVHSTGKAARGSADAHATGKASRGDGSPRPFEQRVNSARPGASADVKAARTTEWPDEFVLDGVKYRNEGILSDSSGEALVFTLTSAGRKYALKLYYYDPDHRPNHKILEKIRQLGESGLLVKIISHGEWVNPASPSEKNDYELMEFCEGGSLENVVLEGDEKALAEVAVRMGAAIDFLSKHGILHRDIKPGNFFYADKEKTRIVLADFGISAECPIGGTCRIDEMRSPVYASPEFYVNVPGEPAEVGAESDFFSLGVSLLCLWMGKAKLTAKEGQLLKAKMNESLPMPKDMSEHARSLIKGLTRLKMADRANFDDIKRWAKGETLDSGDARDAHSGFHVVFNSATNKVANSPAELARLLVDDMALGKKYLYSGRVTRWLEETDRNELAVNVEEIVEEIYPDNQRAGLMAVAYMLDPSMDYVAPDGTHYTDPAEITWEILQNNASMSIEVTDPESDLMVYLRALKLDKTVDTITEYVKSEEYEIDEENDNLNSFVACEYLALLVNPSANMFMSVDDGWQEVSTIDQLIELLREEGDIDSINRALISSPAFIVWLSSRNPALAGKVRMLHDKADDDPQSIYLNSNSAYRIVYELNPAMDFDFGTDDDDPERIYSIAQVGRYLNGRLDDMQQGRSSSDDFDALFYSMEYNPLGHYLRARGESYFNFLKWNMACMEVESDDNSQKAGDYDYIIAAYRSVAGFLGESPDYTIGDKRINTLDDLRQFPKKTLAAEIGGKDRPFPSEGKKSPWLDAWLAVQFQENPRLDLSTKFTYEKEAAKEIEFIGSIAPDDYYVKRYNKAIGEIDAAAGELRRSDTSIKGKRNFFLVAGLLPTIVVILGTLIFGMPEFNPIKGHYWVSALLLFVGITWYYTVDESFWVGLCNGAVGGLIGGGILYAAFAWFPLLFYVAVGVALIGFAVWAIKNLMERNKIDTGGVEIHGDEFEFRQLDALYFAYRQTDDTLDNVIKKYSSTQRDMDSVTRQDLSYVGWRWIAIVWTVAAFWFFVTPQVSGKRTWVIDYAGLEQQLKDKLYGKWTGVYTDGTTRIVCKVDSLDEKKIFGTMSIAGQAPLAAKGQIVVKQDTVINHLFLKVDNHQSYIQSFSIDYDRKTGTYSDTYTDRKNKKHDLVVSAPWQAAPEAEVPVKTPGKSTKKSKKSKKSAGSVYGQQSDGMYEEPAPAQKSENVLCEDVLK